MKNKCPNCKSTELIVKPIHSRSARFVCVVCYEDFVDMYEEYKEYEKIDIGEINPCNCEFCDRKRDSSERIDYKDIAEFKFKILKNKNIPKIN